METKYQIEIDDFRRHFHHFKDKKIVIYGIGRRTLTLLPGIRDFNIVGLLDRDLNNIGRVISEIPVISMSEAEKIADCIIINSDSTNFRIIYKRIFGTTLPIYYANGQKPDLSDLDIENYQKNSYWQNSYKKLIDEIKNHDVISFDLFDTLIMRRILSPTDIFKLMDKRLSVSQTLNFDLIAARQKAAAAIKDKEPLLQEIYEVMIKQNHISQEQAEKIMRLELDLEFELCVPRQKMIDIFYEAKHLGKKVYIVSDTYLEYDHIKPILNKCGLVDISEENILLSSVRNKTKASGSLWQEFKEIIKGQSALHIGDNKKSDVIVPQNYGIDTFYIMSAKDIFQSSSIADFLPKAITLSDSVHLGLLANRLFSDPFVLNSTNGKLHFSEATDFGYAVFGGILTRFLTWLYNEVKANNCEQILFFGRDGYFLQRDYKEMQHILNINYIEGRYLPISRRLMYMVNLENEEDFIKTARSSYNGTFEDYLYSRFNIKAGHISESYNKKYFNTITIDKDKLIKWLEPYRSDIMKEAARERKNYLSYLKKHDLFPKDKKCAIVDHRFYGTTQYYFQRLTGQKYNGYYFSVCLNDKNEFKYSNSMYACFNDESDPDATKGLLNKKGAFTESFLTAPYGMLRYIDENGEFVCEPDKMNQKNFNVKEKVNEGVLQYMKEFLNIYGMKKESGINSIEEFTHYKLLNGTCSVDPSIMKGFYYDNDMIGTEEQPMEL